MKQKVSTEIQAESARITNGIKKPDQTKEQTKLIAAGIEKGIFQYKKTYKAKLRQLDKQKKQKSRSNTVTAEQESVIGIEPTKARSSRLPWALLALSWAGFAGYLVHNGVLSIG
jgi:hypothetical protein